MGLSVDRPAAYLWALGRLSVRGQRSPFAVSIRRRWLPARDRAQCEVGYEMLVDRLHIRRCIEARLRRRRLPAARGGGLRRFARLRSPCWVELRRTRVCVRRRVVNASRRPLSVASRRGWFRELYGRHAREPFFVLHRPNGTVKLSGVQGCWTGRGRDSYSRAAGPEHGRARSLPYRRYAALKRPGNEALDFHRRSGH